MRFFQQIKDRLTWSMNNQRPAVPPPGAGRLGPHEWGVRGGEKSEPEAKPGQPIAVDLDGNIDRLREIMGRDNVDIIIRDFIIGTNPSARAALFFVEGLADRETHIGGIIRPLMSTTTRLADMPRVDAAELPEYIRTTLLPTSQARLVKTLEECIDAAMTGESVILIADTTHAIVIETRGWESRGVQEPANERLVRGPREGFTEVIRFNTALIRRRIRDPRLRLDMLRVGQRSRTDIAVAYIHGLTDPDLITEVKRRIESISTDVIPDAGYIEQFIEDRPFSPFPQVQWTERPDRVATALAEGRLVVLVDGSPTGLIIPTTLTSFLHSSEDYYERTITGTFFRFIRSLAILIAVTLPAFYLAITTFNPEMVPTKLALAFASARERVPFPALLEIIIMELGIELVIEAGLRLPEPVGQTVGIVGALLLGQAAVEARLVSPIIVIIVAMTALASFAIPHYSAAISFRAVRFAFIILGGTLGLFGVSAGIVVLTIHLASLTSIGTPYLTPIAPLRPQDFAQDTLMRAPLWTMEKRPDWLHTRDDRRQAPSNRKWAGGKPGAKTGDKSDQQSEADGDKSYQQSEPDGDRSERPKTHRPQRPKRPRKRPKGVDER